MKNFFIGILALVASSACAQGDGNSDGREILVRFKTERLNPAQKFEVIRDGLAEHDLKNRVQLLAALVQEIPNMGFSQADRDSLFRSALEDLKKVPARMFESGDSCHVASEAVGCLGLAGLRFSLTQRVMSHELGHEFMVGVLKAPWLDGLFSQSAIWIMSAFSDRKLTYPYYREGHELIMAHPSFGVYSAEKIVMGLIKPPVCGEPSCGATEDFVPSWKNRQWLMEKVLATGLASAKQLPHMAAFQKQFALGTDFEARATGILAKDTQLLIELIQREENTPYMADIVNAWLVANEVPENLKVELVEALIKSFERVKLGTLYLPSEHTTTGAMTALLGLFLHFQLPESTQEKLFHFFFTKTLESGKSAHARYMAMAMPFSRDLKVRMGGMQKPLEQHARSSPASESTSDVVFTEEKHEWSHMHRMMELVQSCKDPSKNHGDRAQVCDSITDDRAIYRAVAANPNVHPKLREQAKRLAGD